MFSSFRSAAVAAAAMTLVAGPAPAHAAETLAATLSTSIPVDHAAAANAAAGFNDDAATPGLLAHDVDFSTPVAEHAVAPVAPAGGQNGERPSGQTLSELVAQFSTAEAADAELACLAGAVYFESKGEPLEGQLAVAEVIINRSESGKFPTSLCGVVKQKSQFSFVRGGRIPSISKGSEAWRKAVAIATIARQELAESRGADAMFFHARYVSPGWRGLRRVGTIGNHIFYR